MGMEMLNGALSLKFDQLFRFLRNDVSFVCLASFCLLGGCTAFEKNIDSTQQGAAALIKAGPFVVGEHTEEFFQSASQVRFPFLQYLPENYENQESWPLVLTLHHAGAPGKDLVKVKDQGIPKLIESGRDFPFITVAPQLPHWMPWHPDHLSQFLDFIEGSLNIDKSRIYVTGMSLGGFGTFDLAAHDPKRFAAIAPICGGGKAFLAKRLVDTNIWAFHGDRDFVVEIEYTQKMIEAIRAEGGAPRFTIYKGAGHSIAERTYNDPRFFDWLLAQKL